MDFITRFNTSTLSNLNYNLQPYVFRIQKPPLRRNPERQAKRHPIGHYCEIELNNIIKPSTKIKCVNLSKCKNSPVQLKRSLRSYFKKTRGKMQNSKWLNNFQIRVPNPSICVVLALVEILVESLNVKKTKMPTNFHEFPIYTAVRLLELVRVLECNFILLKDNKTIDMLAKKLYRKYGETLCGNLLSSLAHRIQDDNIPSLYRLATLHLKKSNEYSNIYSNYTMEDPLIVPPSLSQIHDIGDMLKDKLSYIFTNRKRYFKYRILNSQGRIVEVLFNITRS